MNDFVMSASYEGVLMENLETCMQQGIATSPMIIGALCNVDLPIVEGCAIALLSTYSIYMEIISS